MDAGADPTESESAVKRAEDLCDVGYLQSKLQRLNWIWMYPLFLFNSKFLLLSFFNGL